MVSSVFLVWQPYLFFFHIYNDLCVPCLAGILVFANVYTILSHIHKYFNFGDKSCLTVIFILQVPMKW